jgi:NADH-quinone oxidoreductase subunit F
MVDAAYRFSRFLSVESCGQCPPCKLGSSAITEHLERIETGVGDVGDLNAITGGMGHVTDGSRCYLATEEQLVVTSILGAFPDEFTEHLELGACPRPRRLPIPKLVDLTDGRAVYDESFWRKQPDWTYANDDQGTPDGRE